MLASRPKHRVNQVMSKLASTKNTKSFIIKILKPVKFWLLGLILVQFTWGIDLSLRPYILKIIIDRLQTVTNETIVNALSTPLILYISMSFIVISMFRVYDYIFLNLSPILKRHIGDILMKRMMQHSMLVFQNNFAGNLANKIKDVMSGIPDLIRIVDEFCALGVGLIIAAFTMWTINFKFTILFVTWVAIFSCITLLSIKRAKQLSEDQAEIRSVTVGQMVDILSNIINIKLFARQKTESNRLMGYLDKYVASEKKRDWYFLWLFAAQGLSFVIYQAVGFVFLMELFKTGAVTTGDFALLITLNIAIINQLWSLSKIILSFTEIFGNVSQGLNIVMSPIDIVDSITAKPIKVVAGKIEFDKVNFNYHGISSIFNDKTITIHPGQKVGLVGYSGGGKSTFINLIMRLYDVQGGHILIDGENILNVTQESLHESIAMIPQDPSLFHRTLIENIRYGKISASNEEVIVAAKQAHAHEFIMQLPDGYNSLVGERGVKLSGGQRQRISIARAILKNAPILIMDEATSQLDSITEQHIQDSMSQLMQNKTTLVIAHRLSTLLHMDRILVFDKGKIVEDGNYAELLSNNGQFKALWDTQVGGYIIDQDDDE